MNLMYEQICHDQFGVGTVVCQTETIITVEFCEKHGVKKFLYPSCFELFLKLSNPALKKKMDCELERLREQEEAERKKRVQEEEKRIEEERQARLEKKRTAAKKRSPAKKTTANPKK